MLFYHIRMKNHITHTGKDCTILGLNYNLPALDCWTIPITQTILSDRKRPHFLESLAHILIKCVLTDL